MSYRKWSTISEQCEYRMNKAMPLIQLHAPDTPFPPNAPPCTLPAFCPKMETDEFPPKKPMYFCTHFKASC